MTAVRAVVGPHRFWCGRVEDGAVDHVLDGERVDVVYTDPPWGPGLLKWFKTHNGGEGSTDWPAFLDALCAGIAGALKPGGQVFVDMGLQWAAETSAALARHGIPTVRQYAADYVSGGVRRPHALIYATTAPAPNAPETLPTGLGEARITWALQWSTVRGQTLLDPCVGKGATVQAAIWAGLHVRACELNPKRLEHTLKLVRRQR